MYEALYFNQPLQPVMNKLQIMLPLAAVCLLLPGCEIFGTSADGPDRALTEPLWILERVEDVDGRRILSPRPGEAYRIAFEAEGKGRGVDACNTCAVTYALGRGDAISIQMGGCTEKACSPQSLSYSSAVTRATSYTIQSDRLRLQTTDFDGEVIVLVHIAWERGPF